MKPAAAVQEPICLTEEILTLRTWRIPDLVAYQHAYDEWWLAPLDDTIRLFGSTNRVRNADRYERPHNGGCTPAEIWNENMRPGRPTRRMASRTMVLTKLSSAILEQSLRAVIGIRPNGIFCSSRYVKVGQGQRILREKTICADFHIHELKGSGEDDGHFDLIETTVSHLFREPSEALGGPTYGRLS